LAPAGGGAAKPSGRRGQTLLGLAPAGGGKIIFFYFSFKYVYVAEIDL
jgi:hypothetical protein